MSSAAHTIRPDRLRPTVLKFGGTSVQDAQAMLRVVAILERERGKNPVVVTSACAGITNSLLECAAVCKAANHDEALALVKEIRARHIGILHDLCPANNQHYCLEELTALLDELEQLVHGVTLLNEVTLRTTDAFASFGERLSSLLLATAFRVSGWNAALADSREFIITDDTHCSALPLMEEIDQYAPEILIPLLETHDVVIAQGFIGATKRGATTTIGRGGSDHTGALIGAALHARDIQIWTDVSGILTADPRIVPEALVVPEVTFTEARELAYFGAKVIHPDTIIPAVERNIPVVIKNSMRPEDPGTRILQDDSPVPPGIHSLTTRGGMMMLQLGPRDARDATFSIEQAIGLFKTHGAQTHCAVLAESRATVVIETADFNDILFAALESACSVQIMHNMALLCMIGAGVRTTPSLLSAPLSAMGNITAYLVSAGSSNHTVLLGIPEAAITDALKAIHAQLFS